MGARLVKLAFIYATDIPLTPNEFRLVTWMALTALDDDPTPRYFDTREASALGLGRRVVDAGYGDEHDERERTAAFEAVKVAMRGLDALAAVERVKLGRNGRRSEFVLRLDTTLSKRSPEYLRRLDQGKGRPSVKGRTDLPSREG